MKALIIHGWTYSIERYKKISLILKARDLTNFILNVPGLTEKIERSWNLDDYINWLKNKIDKQNGKVILIGHSNGGRIAAAFASKYPQKLSHLILIDSAGIYHDELHNKLRLLFFSTLAKIGKKISSSRLLKDLLYKLAGENDYKAATPEMKKTMLNLIKLDLSIIFAKITVPTLIIWGENDKVTPLADGRLIHRLIKSSELYIVKGAKHSPHFTHTEEVAEVISKTVAHIPNSHPELVSA